MRKSEKKFKTIKSAVAYLTRQGWRISSKSMYRHVAQGWITKAPWDEQDLDNYSAKHLQPAIRSQPTKGRKVGPGPAALIAAREEKIRVDIECKKFELAIRRGEYVERTLLETALSKRALILRSDFVNFCHTKSPKICEVLSGDRQLVPDLIQYLKDEIDQIFERYATPID